MFITNLSQKTTFQKIKYTIHLAGLGFFLRWLSEMIGPIYLIMVIPAIAFIQFKYTKQPIDGYKNIWRDVLIVLLVFGYGVGSLWNFVGHFFLTEIVADSIGWAKSPFQIELAGYHLAFGLMSLLSLWNRNLGYWGAIVHGMAIFLFSAAGIHIFDMMESQNYSYGNASLPILLGTTLYPAAVILIYWKFRSTVKMLPRQVSENFIAPF